MKPNLRPLAVSLLTNLMMALPHWLRVGLVFISPLHSWGTGTHTRHWVTVVWWSGLCVTCCSWSHAVQNKMSGLMSDPSMWGPPQSLEEPLLSLVRFSSVTSSDCWKDLHLDKRGSLVGFAQLIYDPFSNTETPWDVTTQNCRAISCVIVQEPRLGCGRYLLIHEGIHLLPRSRAACPCAISYRYVERESPIFLKYRLPLSLTWLHMLSSACFYTHMPNRWVCTSCFVKQQCKGENKGKKPCILFPSLCASITSW